MASRQQIPPNLQLPTYARPTRASQQREESNRSPPNSPITRKRPHPSSPVKREVLRRHSLSTISSRTKARWPGAFRFLDLPAELRNRVYEYTGIERGCRRLDLRCLITAASLTHLPSALLCNKQMCDEAGSFYFPTGRFDITIDWDRFDNFLNWLKALGASNLKRLTSNPQVTIRLVHSRRQCRSECQYESQVIRTLNGYESLCITGLHEGDQGEHGCTHAALNNWTFKFDCSATLTVGWYPYYYQRAFRDVPRISVPAIARLRTVLKGVFAILNGEEPGLNDSRFWSWFQKSVETPYSQIDLVDDETAGRQYFQVRRHGSKR